MNERHPLVSVIIPVYNRAHYIVETLDSILNENYSNKEIVLIDDGSTDETDSIIRQWIEQYQQIIPVVYKSRENRGFVKTLNELIAISNGEYIVFLGSDDYLLNNGILKRYDYLKNNPEKLMVIGDCTLIDESGRQIHESAFEGIGKADKQLLQTDNGLRKFMILNGYVPGATLMADKRIYHNVLGFYDERFHTEDWVYYIRAVADNLLGFLNETVAAYRRHNGNACFSAKMVKTAKQQLSLSIELLPQFYGIFRFYMILRSPVFSCLYIPYLSTKFWLVNLQDQSHQSKNKNLQYLIDGLIHLLITIKTIFMESIGLLFARRNVRS